MKIRTTQLFLLLFAQITFVGKSLANSVSCSSALTSNPTVQLPHLVDNYMYWTLNSQMQNNLTETRMESVGDQKPSEYIGLLQLNYQGDLKFNRKTYTGSSYQDFRLKIDTALDKVFTTYAKRKIIPESAIAELKKIEDKLPKTRCIYLVSSDPITEEPYEVIRIFDASPRNATHFKKGFTRDQHSSQLPIELEYPHIQLIERKTQQNPYLIELGRLVKTESIKEENLDHTFARVARFIIQHHDLNHEETTPIIYIEATRVGRKLYQRYGFNDAVGPDILGQPDRYILRISSRDFVNHFLIKLKTAEFTAQQDQLSSSLSSVVKILHSIPSPMQSNDFFNQVRNFQGMFFSDIMKTFFNEGVYLQAEAFFQNYFTQIANIESPRFWNDFNLVQAKILATDSVYLNFVNLLKNDLPQYGNATILGVNDLTLPLQLIENKNQLTMSIQSTTSFVTKYLAPAAKNITQNSNWHLSASDELPKSGPLMNAIYLNQILFKQRSKQDIQNLFHNCYSRLEKGGTLIIREPTPREGKFYQFHWYGITLDSLANNTISSLSDIYYSLFAVGEIAKNEKKFNFLTAQELLDLGTQYGFKVKKIERMLLGKDAYLVLEK